MPLSVGIVGLPSAGKSTLFSALSQTSVDIAAYPFTTIEPNVGIVPVPDQRLDRLAQVSQSEKTVEAVLEVYDIAGIVKGAHQGEGLGNQFLAHIREVDAILEVVRGFEDTAVTHVEGEVHPFRDHEIIEAELMLKDLETVEGHIARSEKKVVTQGSAQEKARLEICSRLRDALKEGAPARRMQDTSGEVMPIAHELSLLTAKPLLVLVNTEALPAAVEEKFTAADIPVVAMDVKEEEAAVGLSDAERQEMSLPPPALPVLLQELYALLSLISFFTSGPKESRAWTIQQGTAAREAAGVIHTDFAEKFIRADVVNWKVFCDLGGWAAARSQGKVRSEGKEYVVQDGDVVEVRHGAH